MAYRWNVPDRPKLVMPETWRPVENYPELHGIVALDTETDDPGLAADKGSSWATDEGSVVGFSVAWREGYVGGGFGGDAPITRGFYVGVNHAAGNSDPEKAFNWLRAQAAKPDVHLVYNNAIYDMGWLKARHGIEPASLPTDVQGMAALLDEKRHSYSLDTLAHHYLGRRKSTAKLKEAARALGYLDPYKAMKKLPTWAVAEYGTDDAVDTLDLYYAMMPLLEEQDLLRVLEMERECLLIGRDLKMRGVRVNQDQAAKVRARFVARRDELTRLVFDKTGIHVDPNDKDSVVRALLIENPELQFRKTPTGQYQVNATFIDGLKSPVGDAIRMIKKLTKAVETFIDGYIYGYTGRDGRIHADFNPLRRNSDDDDSLYGVAGGRWSSSGPNLQNIPRRDPYIGPAIRSCFEPEDGQLWGKLDYSSQEPRLAAHFAYKLWKIRDRLSGWEDSFEGADQMVQAYLDNPELSMHKVVAKGMDIDISADPETYDKVKIMNLGIIYGMGGKKFANTVGLPTKEVLRYGRVMEVAGDEAQALLDKHFERFPWIKDLANFSAYWASQQGYMKTVSGRRIRFEEKDERGRIKFTHKALNAAVQGSAADQMKWAQIGFRRAGIPITVVVHDDANLSIDRGDAGRRTLRDAAEIMANAIQLEVPSLAEGRVGRNWGSVGYKHKGLL